LTIAGHSLQYTGSELLGENLSGRQQMIALNVLLMIVVVALIAFALAPQQARAGRCGLLS
jgi:hypothetical protein